jgi:hypothetical protein
VIVGTLSGPKVQQRSIHEFGSQRNTGDNFSANMDQRLSVSRRRVHEDILSNGSPEQQSRSMALLENRKVNLPAAGIRKIESTQKITIPVHQDLSRSSSMQLHHTTAPIFQYHQGPSPDPRDIYPQFAHQQQPRIYQDPYKRFHPGHHHETTSLQDMHLGGPGPAQPYLPQQMPINSPADPFYQYYLNQKLAHPYQKAYSNAPYGDVGNFQGSTEPTYSANPNPVYQTTHHDSKASTEFQQYPDPNQSHYQNKFTMGEAYRQQRQDPQNFQYTDMSSPKTAPPGFGDYYRNSQQPQFYGGLPANLTQEEMLQQEQMIYMNDQKLLAHQKLQNEMFHQNPQTNTLTDVDRPKRVAINFADLGNFFDEGEIEQMMDGSLYYVEDTLPQPDLGCWLPQPVGGMKQNHRDAARELQPRSSNALPDLQERDRKAKQAGPVNCITKS